MDHDAKRVYFDETIAGLTVEADGGHEIPGFQHGVRESFRGALTGRRLDQGDPPWRWVEIAELTNKPEDFQDRAVWCEETFVFPVDGSPWPRA
ncbi:MAG: hypothetical protein DK306_001613 [Chloroflexi bacterium]|nr:MAG: hypothetical protein DK306_001613 [Chloroflexota bacterium]